MKKAKQWVVGLLVLAVLLLGAGVGVARAQETLEIAGVTVDLSKKGTITGNPGIEEGTVSWDPASKTLTLEDAYIRGYYDVINSSISGLIIKLIHINGVSADDGSAITATASLTIEGDAKATFIVDGREPGISLSEGAGLTIKGGCLVNCRGQHGIHGEGNESLLVEGSKLVAVGDFGGSIVGLKNISLTGCDISYPVGAAFDATLKGVAKDGALVKRVEIGMSLKVKGVLVTTANAGDVLGDGKVHYDAASKTLTLENAEIKTEVAGQEGIYSNIPDLVIKLVGSNTISSKASSGIMLEREHVTIEGDASALLNVQGKDIGICVSGYLTLQGGCAVTASASNYGVAGESKALGDLTIIRSTLKATGSVKASVGYLCRLTLKGCRLLSPAGAAFDTTLKGVAKAGALVKEQVEIGPMLVVGGILVTMANAGNVVGGHTVRYDASSKTLTLNNARLGAGNGIEVIMPDLTIKLIGSNAVSGNVAAGILCKESSVTIEGDASASLDVQGAWAGISIDSILTIKGGCAVTSSAPDYGVAGEGKSALTIIGSTLKATGSGKASVSLAGLKLDGCRLLSPAGAAFDATLKGVAKAGVLVKEQVVIVPSVFKVTVDAAVAHGKLTATPEKDVAVGAAVTLTVKPDDGYRLKKGSLKAYKTGDEAVTVEVKDNKFSMPAHDVTVTCVFEKKPAPAPVEEEKPLAVESELLSEVQLQPNPFGDFLELTGLEHAMRIEVVSLLGQTIYTQPLGGQPSLRLETGNWPAGLYMVKLLDGDGGSVVLRGERR